MIPSFKQFINESWYESPLEKSIRNNQRFIDCVIDKAQEVYFGWTQVDGYCEYYGTGGICDDIAAKITDCIELYLGMDGVTLYEPSEYHTSAYAVDDEKQIVIKIDIPFRNYETGAGYTFTKIPNVKFSPDMILIEEQDYENFNERLKYS